MKTNHGGIALQFSFHVCLHTGVSQIKTLSIFYLAANWIQNKNIYTIFLVVPMTYNTDVALLWECIDSSRKKYLCCEYRALVASAATRTLPATPPPPMWKTCLLLPLWAVRRCEYHWGQKTTNTADIKDTKMTDVGWLQLLNGQGGVEHCHVATRQPRSGAHVISISSQYADGP